MAIAQRIDRAAMMRCALAISVVALTLSGCASGRYGPNPDTEAPKGPHTHLPQLPRRSVCAASAANWQRGSPTDISTRDFDPAVVERQSGSAVEVPGYEGWAWPELDKISPRGTGATRAELDALKLLAVFIQHSDSKPGQQEIVCQEGRKQKDVKGNETCAEAWLVIKDLGGSFGKATKLNSSKMKLEDWDGAGIWKDAKQCVGDMPRSFTGSLEDPKISEAGRRFLAERLAQLSDRQIRDLFTVSNIVKRGETTTAADGSKRPVTVDDWVRVFKRKRSENAAALCAA